MSQFPCQSIRELSTRVEHISRGEKEREREREMEEEREREVEREFRLRRGWSLGRNIEKNIGPAKNYHLKRQGKGKGPRFSSKQLNG